MAAVELVSPGSKDRPESRRVSVAKCAALLRQGVSVAIVDVVTTRSFNLCGDLLDILGQADPSLAGMPGAHWPPTHTGIKVSQPDHRIEFWDTRINAGIRCRRLRPIGGGLSPT